VKQRLISRLSEIHLQQEPWKQRGVQNGTKKKCLKSIQPSLFRHSFWPQNKYPAATRITSLRIFGRWIIQLFGNPVAGTSDDEWMVTVKILYKKPRRWRRSLKMVSWTMLNLLKACWTWKVIECLKATQNNGELGMSQQFGCPYWS